LVDFWAGWCQPCLKMAPIVDEVAAQHGDKLKVVKIDIDANPDVARRYGLVSIPTFNVYRGGELAKTIVGGRPKPALLDELQEFLAWPRRGRAGPRRDCGDGRRRTPGRQQTRRALRRTTEGDSGVERAGREQRRRHAPGGA